MKKIELEEVANGYWVKLTDTDSEREYVYSNMQNFKMWEEIGKFLFRYKIDVKEH